LILSLVVGVGPATHAWQDARLQQIQAGEIPAGEFSRLVREFSEPDGFFRSDNFVSNETSYLHVVDKLKALQSAGGAYVGVGPEQNFTYIAKLRPRIAFIVDIRRQAMLQHLIYKALFHLAPTPSEFLSLLFSRPGPRFSGASNESIEAIVSHYEQTAPDMAAFSANLAAIRRTIEREFRFALDERDRSTLEYVYSAFRDENLNIQYRSGGPNWPGSAWGNFPTLRELILQHDLNGRMGNFLVSREDYEFLRSLHAQNRIIPIVGDFSGPKALPAVADYLKKHGYVVNAFYTSNVEQYLFANGVFSAFAENVRKLPTNERSLFIRAFPNMREPHPAQISGHRLTTLLERIGVFLRDYDQGLYQDYWSLVTTNFIAADEP
jgi:hypothetical protein